jgi:hypothetical protein
MNYTIRAELLDHVSRSKSDYVFISPTTGKAMISVQHAFESARADAGIENFRFHGLCHTAVT